MSGKKSQMLKMVMLLLVVTILATTSIVSALADEQVATPYALETPQNYEFDSLDEEAEFYNTFVHNWFQDYEDCGWNYVTVGVTTAYPFDYVVMRSVDGHTCNPIVDEFFTLSRRLQDEGAYSFTLNNTLEDPHTEGDACYMMIFTVAGYNTRNASGHGIWNV